MHPMPTNFLWALRLGRTQGATDAVTAVMAGCTVQTSKDPARTTRTLELPDLSFHTEAEEP